MKFNLWSQYGALNSKPVFDAFQSSLENAGHTITTTNAEVDVIWSVLWAGRMARNKDIWERARANNKPVIVLEVGGIQRGTTWKIGLNGINRDACFGPTNNDDSRARKLGLTLTPWRSVGEYILICGQHDQSQQWQHMPKMNEWMVQTIKEIRNYSDKKIVIRPHPRCPIMSVEARFKNVIKQQPLKRAGSYDDNDNRFRQYCSPASDGTINSSNCYDVQGFKSGSLQNYTNIWIETNITDKGALTIIWWNGTANVEHPMINNNSFYYKEINFLSVLQVCLIIIWLRYFIIQDMAK
jgi:hypothetical protein